MSEKKRGRGRPDDASVYREADHARLAEMADLIAAKPELKPDTAMARIGVYDDCVKRRLRRRWKRYGTGYLDRARHALEARTPKTEHEAFAVTLVQRMPRPSRERYGLPGDTMRILDQYRALNDWHKAGALASLAKLSVPSLISPEVAKQVAATKSAWDSPEMRRIGAALSASEPLEKVLKQVKIGDAWRKLSSSI